MAELEEFKFPDERAAESDKNAGGNEESGSSEVNLGGEPTLEVKIESDKPEEDRNRRPLPKKVVQELENDDLDEYSKGVKDRLSQLKRVWHDERRAKEAATRQKEEALRFAQAQMEENRQLKQRLGVGERAFISEVTKAATNELAVAKEKLKMAVESGDADLITAANEALTDAKLRIKEVERFKPSLQREEMAVKQPQQPQAPQAVAPVVDHKAQEWKQNNAWFGREKGMTAFALGLHEELVESGIDPSSDEYYSRVDTTMRKRFPDFFSEDAEETTERVEKPVSRSKPANVVAPATRSSAPRQVVRLTSSQVAIAKRLGLSNEQYARELMKLEAN